FVVARNQVRSEKRGLRADLERRAETLAESLQETVEPALQRGATSQIRRIVERFGSREHLEGIAVFDEKETPLAVSPRLDPAIHTPPPVVQASLSQNKEIGDYETINESAMYVYTLPLHKDAAVVGELTLFEDASYVEAQSMRIWRDAIWHVIAQILL